MASAGDIHSILYKGGDILKQPAPKYDATRHVERYFPGKVPQYAGKEDALRDEDISDGSESDDETTAFATRGQLPAARQEASVEERVQGLSIQERRLQRLNNLAACASSDTSDSEDDERAARRRRYRATQQTFEAHVSVPAFDAGIGTSQQGISEVEATLNASPKEREENAPLEPGLKRLASSPSSERAPKRSRVIAAPIVVSAASSEVAEATSHTWENAEDQNTGDEGHSSPDSEEDTADAERRKKREKALQRRQQEEEVLRRVSKAASSYTMFSRDVAQQPAEHTDLKVADPMTGPTVGGRGAAGYDDDEEDDSEDSEEEDECSDDDDLGSKRPLFIPAAKREAAREQALTLNDERLEEEREARKAAENREEAKKLLVAAICQEEEEERKRLEEGGKGSWDPTDMPDDDDNVNQEAEYELWKIREMERMLRDRQEEEQRQEELREVERRRTMTDKERRKDDKRLDAQHPKREKGSKYMFMQKYYHKGAFFQDQAASGQEPLYLRDFNIPVGEDAVDKTAVPAPMRLRRGLFGKAGQVKHTHLADVDTTDYTCPWVASRGAQLQRQKTRMAGLKGTYEFDRPSARNRRESRKT